MEIYKKMINSFAAYEKITVICLRVSLRIKLVLTYLYYVHKKPCLNFNKVEIIGAVMPL